MCWFILIVWLHSHRLIVVHPLDWCASLWDGHFWALQIFIWYLEPERPLTSAFGILPLFMSNARVNTELFSPSHCDEFRRSTVVAWLGRRADSWISFCHKTKKKRKFSNPNLWIAPGAFSPPRASSYHPLELSPWFLGRVYVYYWARRLVTWVMLHHWFSYINCYDDIM